MTIAMQNQPTAPFKAVHAIFAKAALARQRVPRSLHEKLKIAAAREGVSLNAYVSNVLAETLGRTAA